MMRQALADALCALQWMEIVTNGFLETNGQFSPPDSELTYP
jgi:hypothetical protein